MWPNLISFHESSFNVDLTDPVIVFLGTGLGRIIGEEFYGQYTTST